MKVQRPIYVGREAAAQPGDRFGTHASWRNRRRWLRAASLGSAREMATEIKVPTLGESVTTATVARWMKHEGEAVAADEPLVELETDKVTVEVSAPSAGVLRSISAPEGSEVPVGALLGLLEAGGATFVAPKRQRGGGPAPAANPAAGINPAPRALGPVSRPATRLPMWLRMHLCRPRRN